MRPYWCLESLGCGECRELQLEEKFQQLEADSYSELKGMISDQKDVPDAVFELFLGKIYKRRK